MARKCDAEIVNGDSLQVYRYLDIGTAKPELSERSLVPHHLFDIIDPVQPFNATDFQVRPMPAIADINSRGRLPLVVGGHWSLSASSYFLVSVRCPKSMLRFGLSWRAVWPVREVKLCMQNWTGMMRQWRPVWHPGTELGCCGLWRRFLATGKSLAYFQEQHRFLKPRYRFLHIFLDLEREQLYQRINERVEAMLAKGFVEEVQGLLDKGYAPGLKPLQSIGYRQIIDHLEGRLSLDQALSDTKQATRRYAKRQLTWFRNDKYASGVDVVNWRKIFRMIGEFINNQISLSE